MKNPNICRWVMFTIIFIGLLLSGISVIISGVEPLPTLFFIGATIAFGGIVYGIVTVRCPFCRHQLSLRGLGTEFCPHCGEKIE